MYENSRNTWRQTFCLFLALLLLGALAWPAKSVAGQLKSNITTTSDYIFAVPTGWTKEISGKANVVCSVPLEECQIGTGGMPRPNAAIMGVTQFGGSALQANREASRSLTTMNEGLVDRTWSFRSQSGHPASIRTVGWTYKSPSSDLGPALVSRLHIVKIERFVFKIFLDYWQNDPNGTRYELECDQMLRGLKRQ